MPYSMPPHERAVLKAAVRIVVEELLAAGIEPTGWQLRRRFPGHGPFTLIELRDELADAGLIDWELSDERETGYLPDAREIRVRAFRVRYGLPLPEEVRVCRPS
jgi:hypothetical protein